MLRGYPRSLRERSIKLCCVIAMITVAAGCGGSLAESTRSRFASTSVEFRPPPEVAPDFDGTLNAYLAFSLEHSPEARAAFERWRAATLRIARARRLPEPALSYGFFVRSVETRVGPQRHRIGLSQSFPWPTTLSAASDAASEAARAAQRSFEAEVLALRHRIATAYWELWRINEEHARKAEHDVVLEALAGAVRGRLRTGVATFADLNQIELNIARHHDHDGVHAQALKRASAQLRASIGLRGGGQGMKAIDTPVIRRPVTAERELHKLARSHPRVAKHAHLARTQRHRERSERAAGLPRFRIGVDFVETGPSRMPGPTDSGKDAVIVTAGISLPLWRGSYRDSARAARAESEAHLADRQAAMRRAESELERAAALVRDSARRVRLHDTTLIPQAQSTYRAVIGGYQAGRASVAQMILAQRDLLELQLERVRAIARHAQAWAQLEFVVGSELPRHKDNK